MATLAVSVVSADREVWSGEASLVVARTVEGEIGIMPGHEPMLAILAAGEVRLALPGGNKIEARAEKRSRRARKTGFSRCSPIRCRSSRRALRSRRCCFFSRRQKRNGMAEGSAHGCGWTG